jgi:hypothetical protein
MMADLRVGKAAMGDGGVGVWTEGGLKIVMVVGGVTKEVGQEVAGVVREGLGGGEALEEVSGEVRRILEEGWLVVGVWKGEGLEVGSWGGEGWLLRGGKWVKLTKPSFARASEGEDGEGVSLVSGKWLDGDRVVLKAADGEISLKELGDGEVEAIAEKLKEKVGEGAVAAIQVQSSKFKVQSGIVEGGKLETEVDSQGKADREYQASQVEVRGKLTGGLGRSVVRGKSKGVAVLGRLRVIVTGLVGKVTRGLSGVVEWLVRRLPGEEQVYVMDKRRVKRGRKVALAVGMVVLAALVVSVVWGVKERKQRVLEERWRRVAEEVNYRLEEGRVLAELNPTRARKLLEEAKDLLTEAENEEGLEGKVTALTGELNKVLGVALGEHEVEGELWFDLSLVGEGVKGDDWAIEGKKMVILDKEGRRVVELDMELKATDLAMGGEAVSGGEMVAAGVLKDYVVTNAGVVTEEGVVVEKDAEWGDLQDLESYAGNLYLLDKSMGMIWRYPVVEGGGFGRKQEWLAQPADLTESVGMVIDGAIWVAEGQDVRKFVMGVEENFRVKDLNQDFEQIGDLYTGPELGSIYVLDRGEGRVVVIEKESGKYVEQYEWGRMGEARRIAVDEKGERLLMLIGREIFEIEMR